MSKTKCEIFTELNALPPTVGEAKRANPDRMKRRFPLSNSFKDPRFG